MLLYRGETKAGGLVCPGPESHPRFDANHNLIWPVCDLTPRWRNYKPADDHWLPVLFPLSQPISIQKMIDTHIANGGSWQVVDT